MGMRARLAEMMRQLVAAGSSHARMHHDGRWVLRYRDRIDVVDALPGVVIPTSLRWRGERLLQVAGQQYLFHRFTADARPGAAGVDPDWLAQADLLLDQARGADRLRLAPAGRSRSWKNLAQERGIPPWLRPALPILRREDAVVHAAPFGMNRDLAGGAPVVPPAPGSERVAIEWLAPPAWARWI